jgi:Anti-sigma factor NepR
MATPESPLDLVRAGIGSALRTLLSGVLTKAIPDEMVELLRQLDRSPRSDDESDRA